MTREIKFKAWEHDGNGQGIMYSMKDIMYFDHPQLTIGDWILRPHQNKNIVLRQYIGLKDKSENEIYDGDIVQSDVGAAWDDDVPVTIQGVITWKFQSWWFEGFQTNEHNGIYEFQHSKIIGNIYETPELLPAGWKEKLFFKNENVA